MSTDNPAYLVIGHITDDLQADGSILPGSTALYAAVTALRLGLRVAVATAGQLREVVVEYLLANPDNRQLDASALVWNAIIAKWPNCGTTVRR